MATIDFSKPIDGEQFVAYDDAPRWIGAWWPSADYVERQRVYVEWLAVRLADAVVDGDDVTWRLEDYREQRAELRHVQSVHDRILAAALESREWWSPGALVRA